MVLDKTGQVKYVKDGALSQQEVQQVISLVKSLLQD